MHDVIIPTLQCVADGNLLTFKCPTCGATNAYGRSVQTHSASHCPCWPRSYHLAAPDLREVAGHA